MTFLGAYCIMTDWYL